MSHPRSVHEIFENISGRKDGLRKALTVDVEGFYRDCNPEKENLCLYGEPSGAWALDLPAEEVPAELPEPCLGINFARDGMARKEWLALVAVHSDAWLMSVAFYYGAKLNADQRKQLFTLMNAEPTLFEMVTGKRDVQMGKRARHVSMVCDRDIQKAGTALLLFLHGIIYLFTERHVISS
uniref:PHD finger protein ALFIN-LIKE 2 n=1 Tax=Ulva partita TaxID=1605170 RepID=A0A1C9ZPT5_9CHLO|nr:PHD finger protein ALFIN-LIKE 2 [Ulva partita]